MFDALKATPDIMFHQGSLGRIVLPPFPNVGDN